MSAHLSDADGDAFEFVSFQTFSYRGTMLNMDPMNPESDWPPSSTLLPQQEMAPPSAPMDRRPSVSVPPLQNRNIVPAACLACRTKHLKCDGVNPCSRCAANGVECSYIRSRRGYKGPRRVIKRPSEDSRQSTYAGQSPTEIDLGLRTVTNVLSTMRTVPGPESEADQAMTRIALAPPENGTLALAVDRFVALPPSPMADLKERCMEAFFHYFYPAHPFVLPKAVLPELLRRKPLAHLEAAMRFVGSYYVKAASTDAHAQELTKLLSAEDCIRDGFTVQAMLMFSIGLDGACELKRASDLLVQAQDLALKIGMHQRDFASIHGEGRPVLEESWRRTWWELYVVDGMIAGVHQQSSFRLNLIPADVLLPCEESEFVSGRIPTPHSIEEFDDQWFAQDELSFSSFAYRIAAIRNLGRVLQLEHIVFQDNPIIDKTDTYLVNWHLHLPDSKKLAIDGDGQVDEMLFQAQMITNASSIMLHRPYSQLDTSVVRSVTSCAPHRPISGGQSFNVHAAKIIQAADKISKLITLPIPLIRHTHFFTCVITLASIVHLSCWAALLPSTHDENLKQQIRLNTGALKSISDVWPSANRVGGQVKGVAQEVFNSRKLAAAEGFWENFTQDEVMRSMIEDEGIINEFLLA